MRISDWSSDVCSSDLLAPGFPERAAIGGVALRILRDGLCPGPDCRVQALVYSSSPLVQGRAGRIDAQMEIGRASCRERVCQYVSISVVAVSLKKQHKE